MEVTIAGAGGFIGGHLADYYLKLGYSVRAVDIKPLAEWFQLFPVAENLVLDLSLKADAEQAVTDVDVVINLAADMGGMGFIANNRARCAMSVLINTHLLQAAQEDGVRRYFYASSACIYPEYRQNKPEGAALAESDAYPAQPEEGYGEEKLFSEELCRFFAEDFHQETRVARFHNVYGPNGTWSGGREKAPAAICRKVIEAKLSGVHKIDIWGDGEQTRSFMYIDDCLFGINLITMGDYTHPLNLGSSELVSINGLVDIVEDIAEIKLERSYDLSAPQGVRGRNSDNSLIRSTYGWEPDIALREGLEKTYAWIYDQMT